MDIFHVKKHLAEFTKMAFEAPQREQWVGLQYENILQSRHEDLQNDNKELKKILHMGAMSVIHCNPEMKSYYSRKIVEGKHALSVINAVKNKLVLRAVAVIKSQAPYVDNFVKPEQTIKNVA